MRSAHSTNLATTTAIQRAKELGLPTPDDYNQPPVSTEQFNYNQTRDTFTFETCKLNLGYDQAVAFEIEYQGAHELQQQSKEALMQVNSILTALGKPALLRWPVEERSSCDGCDGTFPASHVKEQGFWSGEVEMSGPACCRKCRGAEEVEESDWTPVDEALGMPVLNCGDFWCVHFLKSADAVQLASDVVSCDVVDLETERPISTSDAWRRLDDPRYGETEAFGVAFPEKLNLFITDFVAGLYPGLEAK
jgi:hypothetical protein